MTNGDPERPDPADETAGAGSDPSVRLTDASGEPLTIATDEIPTMSHSMTRVGRLPELFGNYKILKTLGEGGMGAVYLAEDMQLERRVAIKIPFVDEDDTTGVLNRFRREAKALASIVHPNICPIHAFGELFGVHFIAMTYVEGKSLSEYAHRDKPMPIEQALILVHKLASALQYTHDVGVIHRDLKPGNIIINSRDEPVILDFGLARREGKFDAVATMDGEMIGTPAYMPPEQFAGDVAAIGPGCDIYSLGVILYELLTTRRPFDGDMVAIMSKIAREVPPPPSQHRAEIDSQLDAICLRALEKRPEDRFASMEEFASVLAERLKKTLKLDATETTSRATLTSSPGETREPQDLSGDKTVHEPQTDRVTTLAGDVSGAPSPDALAGIDTATAYSAGQGYQLIEQIGEGQYGEVWRGVAPGGIEVAIKKLLFPIGHKASQAELQALELMKRLRHSYLMQLQAYWVMEDNLIIVMDLADGSLEDRHTKYRAETGQGIPREELFGYLREAAEAIDYLHQKEVLHRDIKPGNILLVGGHVKVADFGIATAGALGQDQLVKSSATLGTPLYMAPELWNKKAGPRSDQYSLAVTYLELRVGTELTFNAQNRLDLSLLPEKEQAVLSKALAADPRERYESCQQFSQALDEIVESEQRDVEEQKRRKFQQAVDRRRSRRLQLVAGAIILACLPAAWYIWQDWQKRDLVAVDMTLTAGAAEPKPLTVTRTGAWGDEPFAVTILPQNLPDGITVSDPQPIKDGVEFGLTADLQMSAQEVEITLVGKAGSREGRRSLTLAVESARCITDDWDQVMWAVPDGAIKVEIDGKVYYDRIDRVIPDGTPNGMRVALLLVREGESGPRTFYCMRDKVTNRLFEQFVLAAPQNAKVKKSRWSDGALAGTQRLAASAHPNHPVFRVSVADADAFAQWFGGRLPSVEQWDKAAGRWDHDEGEEGPYTDSWNTPDNLGVAVGRLVEGPLPVGEAWQDVSCFGCRDMFGNGLEWTDSLVSISGRTVRNSNPGDDDLVFVRSRGYDSDEPLRFSDLENELLKGSQSYKFNENTPDVSFRCVVE